MKCNHNGTYTNKCGYCGYSKVMTAHPLKIMGKSTVDMCKDCTIQQLLWAATNHHVVAISGGVVSIDKRSAVDWIKYFSSKLHFALVPGPQFDLALGKLDEILANLGGDGGDVQVLRKDIEFVLKCFKGEGHRNAKDSK